MRKEITLGIVYLIIVSYVSNFLVGYYSLSGDILFRLGFILSISYLIFIQKQKKVDTLLTLSISIILTLFIISFIWIYFNNAINNIFFDKIIITIMLILLVVKSTVNFYQSERN